MGRKVVLLKSESEEYRRAFEERRYEVEFVEPLEFAFRDSAELERELRGSYQGLVLTSPRAVQAVQRVWARAAWAAPVWAVGPATAREVRACLGREPRGEQAGSAAGLGRAGLEAEPGRFLFPCGDLARAPPGLAGRVTSLVVYETRASHGLAEGLARLGDAAAAVYFSPSGCRLVREAAPGWTAPAFALGPTTAEELGVQCCGVAAQPTPQAILHILDAYFREHPY